MPSVLQSAIVLLTSYVAATVAAVAGFGGAAILLPVLVAIFGVREAIPILTVAQLVGNGSRVWFNRHELDWRVVGWFALGGVPMALLGGFLFAKAPLSALTRVLGVFLIAIVIWRHARPGIGRRPPLPMPGIGSRRSPRAASKGVERRPASKSLVTGAGRRVRV